MIQIIDYSAGNAPSVLHAVSRLGYDARLARTPQDIVEASHIILPGVGSAKATLESLHKMDILPALERAVLSDKVPFLGICVGMQVLFEHSEEEDTPCLGWLKGRVIKLDAAQVRVPQMGWNQVHFVKQAPPYLQDEFFYFVNSYVVQPHNDADIWGVADYHGSFAAAVQRDNISATQFHGEKSGEAGLALLKHFITSHSIVQRSESC